MDNIKAFPINKYPEGPDRIKKELLDFLPEGTDKEAFFKKYLILLLQR